MTFFKCNKCNQVFHKLIDNDLPVYCCDIKADELIPNQSEEEALIHVPQIRQIGNFVTIKIGKDEHPMVDIHHILFVLIETNFGVQYKYLSKNDTPVIDFIIANDEAIKNVYVYCTVHSLWTLLS